MNVSSDTFKALSGHDIEAGTFTFFRLIFEYYTTSRLINQQITSFYHRNIHSSIMCGQQKDGMQRLMVYKALCEALFIMASPASSDITASVAKQNDYMMTKQLCCFAVPLCGAAKQHSCFALYAFQ